MLSITTIETIKLIVAMVAAYVPTVVISGFFAAWVAKKMGDSTAQDQGYLTLSPWRHIYPLGLGTLLLMRLTGFPFIFGFGQMIPLNEHRIGGRFRNLKLLAALWARSLANVMMLCAAILGFILIFRFVIQPYQLIKLYPAAVESFALLYLVFRELNLMSAAAYMLWGLLRWIIMKLFPEMHNENIFLVFIVEISFLLLLWNYLSPVFQAIIYGIEGLFSGAITELIG